MKTLYQPGSAVEAHMLCDLLKQEGITAVIHGEALQGAIGELPAAGLVRLVVDEADFARARELVERWDAEQPAQEVRPKPPTTRSRVMGFFLLGIALGLGGTYAYVRTPIKVDGTDYNRDGVLDEAWTHSPRGTPVRLEVDRNLDGKVDYVARYDERGLIESAEADDDFNGVFETGMRYRFGNVELTETDTDGDLYRDLRTAYTHGVVSATEFLSPSNGLPLRVEHYRLGKMTHAEVDSNTDGVLDTRVMYTPLGDVSGTAAIRK
jgi:hypothetical protein